jgi:hypothetical protein
MGVLALRDDTLSNQLVGCSRKYVFQTALFLGLARCKRFAYGQLGWTEARDF